MLEADVIEADSGRIGSVVKGKITGDVVNLQGSFINLYATAEIIGRDVTLTQIDQVSRIQIKSSTAAGLRLLKS